MLIGIIGLGLIGGSFARAIKDKTPHTVLGLDRDESVIDRAVQQGAVDLTDISRLPDCDFVIIALPPDVTAVAAETYSFGKNSVVVDTCGVKRAVIERCTSAAVSRGFRYIGGHPMAGREVNGFDESRCDLYFGASMILCPTITSDGESLSTAEELFRSLGFSSVVKTDPETHDRIIALTSQLAHVVSSAYVKSPTSSLQAGFSAGSWRDMTRVALLDPGVWASLFLANQDNLVNELDCLIEHLSEYRNAVSSGDRDRLRLLLQDGRDIKINLKDINR